MADESDARTEAICDECGFAAPDGSDEWVTVTHPPLGRVTRCPDCGSTSVYSRG